MTDIAARVRDQITGGVTMWCRTDIDALLADIDALREQVERGHRARIDARGYTDRIARARALLTECEHSDPQLDDVVGRAIAILDGTEPR